MVKKLKKSKPVHPRHPTATSSITTNSVLKGASHDKYDGAIAAAEAVLGARQYRPSPAAAAREFMTSPYLTRQAMLRVRIPTPEQAAIDWWNSLPEHVRDAVIRADLSGIWARFDRITNPGPRWEDDTADAA